MARVEKTYDHEGAELCRRAYEFANEAHQGQMRKSGEPYIIHPVYVASILTEIMIDPPTIAAGFLHDTVEDCENVSLDTIRENFGDEIAQLVDGVTKLGRLNFSDREEQQA
ncbi:MAG: HD domain-containing protein, partial [Clostridia bacterium]|nr:HD domain-containing protein [Clostridia bacterium]